MSHTYGGDSAYPQPDHYTGEIWQVYIAGATPHVWTKAEVAETASHGIKGIVCTVVPPQDTTWFGAQAALFDSLVAEAVAWGVPEGAPVEIDIEAWQADALLKGPGFDGHAWAMATRSHGYDPWIYSTRALLEADHWSRRRLAEWPSPTPTDPGVPDGYHAWQYAGGVDGDTIDLDVYGPGAYMTPDASGTIEIGAGGVAPPSSSVPAPEPAPAITLDDVVKSVQVLGQRVTTLEIGLEAVVEHIAALRSSVTDLTSSLGQLDARVTALEAAEKLDPTQAPG